MAVGHDHDEGAVGGAGKLALRSLAAQWRHARGHRRREGVRALVDPGEVERKRREREHQCTPHVPGSEEPHRAAEVTEPLHDRAIRRDLDRKTRNGGPGTAPSRCGNSIFGANAGGVRDNAGAVGGTARPPRVGRLERRAAVYHASDRPHADSSPGRKRTGCLSGSEGPHLIEPVTVENLGEQPHAPAAALAEIGSEREPIERGGRDVSGQRIAGRGDGAPFELAAANRSPETAVGGDHHARPGLAGSGAAHLRDRHERATPVRTDHLRYERPDSHRVDLRPKSSREWYSIVAGRFTCSTPSRHGRAMMPPRVSFRQV